MAVSLTIHPRPLLFLPVLIVLTLPQIHDGLLTVGGVCMVLPQFSIVVMTVKSVYLNKK